MAAEDRDYERFQRELNPHRSEEQRRSREHAIAMLRQREVRVHDSDSTEELADLLDAVDLFIAMVESLGGDTYVNTPDSSQPDDPRLVLPVRAPGESVRAYIARIEEARARLRQLRA
jgi:hypothetical protein